MKNNKIVRKKLEDIVDETWFDRGRDSSVWFRIYTSIGLSHKEFLKVLDKINFGGQERSTGFKKIITWRNNFFHHGIKPIITSDVERYIQLLYLDVLRFELNLVAKRHLLTAINSKDFDLSTIGLKN